MKSYPFLTLCALPIILRLTPSRHQSKIQKGINGAHADDTKGMKGATIDWITLKGQSLTPHILWNVKSGRGFNHERTGALLCPTGLD